jgi:phage tail protein X
MRRGKLIMITVAVVLAGIVAALPYQRAPRPSASGGPPATDDSALLLRKAGDPRQGELMALSLSPADDGLTASETSPAADYLLADQQREPVLELPQIRRDEALRSQAMLPELAGSFRPFTETIRLLRDADAADQTPAKEAGSLVLTPPPAEFVGGEPPAEPAPRHHRIVDGDTLESIARRYYDDPTLGDMLFDANRGVLKHREVLPLGSELEIPPRRAARAAQGGVLGQPRELSVVEHVVPPAYQSKLVPVAP